MGISKETQKLLERQMEEGRIKGLRCPQCALRGTSFYLPDREWLRYHLRMHSYQERQRARDGKTRT